ncbi:MAG: SAM-dependent methyltransferase [Acidimicrobiales bacterium]
MAVERFDEFVERALYHPETGFYTAGGGAPGRRGDFLTSPEVGPLFGAVLARALDAWWVELGRPDPYWLVEVGAGGGALARSVAAARPACAAALRAVLVERSPALRDRLAERLPPGMRVAEAAPPGPLVGVVVANELLDNLPFRLLERRAGRWLEVHVQDGAEVLASAADPRSLPPFLPPAPDGARAPLLEQAAAWVRDSLARLSRGRVVVFDYGVETTAELVARPPSEWLRTYRAHRAGASPLHAPGTQDVTCELAWDQLPAPTLRVRQAEWLRSHGLDHLVDEGRRVWRERAHLGDLAALTARSRVREAEALCDPAGLGAFWACEWRVER